MEGGEWRVEEERWRIEDERWRREDGGGRKEALVSSIVMLNKYSFLAAVSFSSAVIGISKKKPNVF